MMTAIDVVRQHTTGSRRSLKPDEKGRYRLNCPIHNGDGENLLVWNHPETGDVMFHCPKGCKSADLAQYYLGDAVTNRQQKKNAPVGAGADGTANTTTIYDDKKTTPGPKNIGKGKEPRYKETARWIYLTADGAPDVLVIRKDAPGHPKRFIQGHYVNGKEVFRKRPGLQPLYCWEQIHNSTRELVIHEGEKACEAAVRAFPEYDHTTWPGGSGAVQEAEWERIRGRSVILCPDADGEKQGYGGQKAMAQLAGILLDLGCQVRWFDVQGLPETNDMANPEPEGVSYRERLEQAIEIKSVEDIPEFAPWPDPFEPHVNNLPDFPMAALNSAPWLRNAVAAIAEQMELNYMPAAIWALGLISGGLIGRYKLYTDSETYSEWGNLYTVAVGQPGSGKTPTLDALKAPLVDFEASLVERYSDTTRRARAEARIYDKQIKRLEAQAGKSDDEAITRDASAKSAELEAKRDQLPVDPPRLTAGDFTEAALAKVLASKATGGACTILQDEGGKLLDIVHGLYSSGAQSVSLLLDCFSGTRTDIERVTAGRTYIDRPLLAIVTGIQPKAFKKHTGGAATDRGLLQRFLYAQVKMVKHENRREAKKRKAALEQYHKTFFNMLNHAWINQIGSTSPVKLVLCPEAETLHMEFRQDVRENLMSDIGEFADSEVLEESASKIAGIAMRIAGAIHAASNPDSWYKNTEIPAQAMRNAIQIVMVSLQHADAAYNSMGIDPSDIAAKMIWAKLLARDSNTITKKELQNSLSTRQREIYNEGLKRLEKWLWIRVDGPAITMNPKAVDLWKAGPNATPPPSLQKWLDPNAA